MALAGKVGRRPARRFQQWTYPGQQGRVVGLVEIFRAMLAAADDAEVSLDQAARLNVAKTLGRWPVTPDWGALFDVDFPPEEQLPRQITMMQYKGSRFDLAD